MNRRRFLGAAGVVAAAGATAFAVDAGLVEPHRLTVTRHVLRSRRAIAGARAVRVVQLTDLHLRSIGGFHERVARAVDDARPDLLVITGDSVDRDHNLPLLGEFLSLLDSRMPKLATWGNWEHYLEIGLAPIADMYARHGCRVLNNESALIDLQGARILVTGLDSSQAGEPDLRAALRGVAPADNHLVLAHCPVQRDQVIEHVDRDGRVRASGGPGATRYTPSLVLAGHTHGGQITVAGWAPITPSGSGPYVAGWYRNASVPLYVSRGIGETMVPLRFGCPPEVAVFDWEVAAR